MTGGNRFNGKRVMDVDLEHEEAARFGIHDKFSFSAWILPKERPAPSYPRQDVAEGRWL